MKYRLALTFAVAALAIVTSAQESNQKVTFAMTAGTIDKVIDALAKKTGTKIAASPAISKEVLFVSVTDVPYETLLGKIADVVSGEWREGSDGIRYLNYDDSLFRKRSKEANDQRAEIARKDLAERIKAFDEAEAAANNSEPPEGGEEGDDPELDFPDMPWFGGGDTYVPRILARIDPHQLVGVGNARIVFSTNPTSMQRRLPNIADLLAKMIKEHNETAAAIQKAKGREGEENPQTVEEKAQEEQMMRMFGGFMQQEDKPITAPPAKVLLIVKRGGTNMFVGNAELLLFDAQGKKIYSASGSVDLGASRGGMEEIVGAVMEGEEGEAPQKVDTTKPIVFSAETQEMMRIFDMNGMSAMFSGNGPKISDGLMNKLRQPDMFDPLSFGPSDSLNFVASEQKLDVVAAIPDQIVNMSDLMVAKGLTVGSFIERLQANRSLVIDTKEGWFTIRPFDPQSTKLYRVDRSSLAKLIRASDSGRPSMDEMAEYALANESPMTTEIVLPYLTIFSPSMFVDMMMGGRGWSAMRLYGTLAPAQKETLRAAGQISIGALTPSQRVHVEELLFGIDTALQIIDPSKPQDELPEFMRMAGAFFGNNSGQDYRTEPTEVMARGLPAQGVIAGLLQKKPILTPASGLMSKMGFDASMIAMFQLASQYEEADGQIPEFGQMKLGERTTLELRLVVAPNIEQTERLSSDAASSDSGSYTMDNLPPVMKAAVDKEVAKLKKMGMFGGG
jgi:hypothetical protein